MDALRSAFCRRISDENALKIAADIAGNDPRSSAARTFSVRVMD